MKLLISSQHGAIVMALMPFLYGMLLAQPVWLHIALLLAWFSLYLMSYPFLSLFKGRNLELYKKWTLIYAVAALIFAQPALWYNWRILYFLSAMSPFILISIYYTRKKDERALLNDFAGIAIFALAGMASYYFPQRAFDSGIWFTALYPGIFFIGVTFYVKSMLRERKNPLYLKISVIFHVACVILFILLQQYSLALVFTPPLIRAAYLPHKKLSVKQVGMMEIAVSLLFFAMLIWATL